MRKFYKGKNLKPIHMMESSPHARGPRFQRLGAGVHIGIIPACAGSTAMDVSPPGVTGDHPRMRGVHLLFVCREVFVKGSSPHARGPRI